MIKQKNIKVNVFDDQIRIDRWLKRNFSSLTQNFIQNKIRRGLIRVNQKKIKSNYKISVNDIINIYAFSEKIYYQRLKEKVDKFIQKKIYKKFYDSIIFESQDFIILDKWQGIVTQGAKKVGISVNDIIKNISQEHNLVHRLDKETSGLLIIAKNYSSTRFFGKMFKDRVINKLYLALCQGIPKNLNSSVKLGIDNKKTNNSYQSLTKYKVINQSKNISLMLFKPLTGKKHQLRIVSKYLNCPIIGDNKYIKSNKYKKEQLMLHASYLNFVYKKRKFNFVATLPKHMEKFMKKISINIPKEKQLITLCETF